LPTIDLSNLQNSTQTLGQSQNNQSDFNKMYMLRSDHAKTMQDKEKHIIEMNAEKTKLEEKLETKDRELIWLRS